MNTSSTVKNTRPLLILIAGPYMSGTQGDAAKIAANRARLESFALPVYQRGHLPVIGEWFALPLVQAAGGREHGDAVFDAYQYPVASRLLERCDGVLRIDGASRGADLDVARAESLGLPVYRHLDELPERTPAARADTAPGADPRVRIASVRVLSDDWFILKKTTFDLLRRDGRWQRQSRETYDRGDGAVLLLFNADRGTVVLTRQFRFPAFANGSADGMLIEACAGLLDGDDAESCIRRECEEETGFRIDAPRKLFEVYMSPGSVTEKLHFFCAECDGDRPGAPGGGDAGEGEDIEVIEMTLVQAMAQVTSGEIRDAKTIMLLQHASLVGLDALRRQ